MPSSVAVSADEVVGSKCPFAYCAKPVARVMRAVLLFETREAQPRCLKTRFALLAQTVARLFGPAGGKAARC